MATLNLRKDNLRNITDSGGGGGDAHECEQANKFADELAVICGYDLASLPASWSEAQPAEVAKTWIERGYDLSAMLDHASAVVREMPDGTERDLAIGRLCL